MDAPLVSIIVPLYNAATTLSETLDTIYGQSFAAWELILFDDGSTDEAPAIALRAAAARPEQARYYQHPDGRNNGPAATRNRAVDVAVGELIAFLDADDLWLPGKLDEQVRWLASCPNAAMVWGPAEYFGQGKQSYKQPTGVNCNSVCFEPPHLVERFMMNIRGTPCPSGVLLRKEAYCRVGGFEERLRRGEDISLWVKIAARYPVLYDDRIWFRYRRHPESSTSRSSREMVKELWELELHRWLVDFVHREPNLAALRPVAENGYHSALRRWAGKRGWWQSRVQVLRGLSYFPGLLRTRWWCLLLDWILPFDFSRRVAAKVHSWGLMWRQ